MVIWTKNLFFQITQRNTYVQYKQSHPKQLGDKSILKYTHTMQISCENFLSNIDDKIESRSQSQSSQNFLMLTPGKTSSPTLCRICSISWTYQIKKSIKCFFSKMKDFFFLLAIILQIILPTSWRGIRCLISLKYFNPNFWAFVSELSFLRSSNVRCPFSYNFSAVAGPIPHTSPNKDIVRTYN